MRPPVLMEHAIGAILSSPWAEMQGSVAVTRRATVVGMDKSLMAKLYLVSVSRSWPVVLHVSWGGCDYAAVDLMAIWWDMMVAKGGGWAIAVRRWTYSAVGHTQ